MRGRELFNIYRIPIAILSWIVSILPVSLRRAIFAVIRNTPGLLGTGFRYITFTSLAKSCGKVVSISEGSFFRHPENLSVGDHVSINAMCYLEGVGGLTIGNNVSIAHSVTIMTTEHDFQTENLLIRDAPLIKKPVQIGDNVWIGAGARVLAGVSIGSGSVVGAGAVVTRDVPSEVVVVGVPARIVKRIGSGGEAANTL